MATVISRRLSIGTGPKVIQGDQTKKFPIGDGVTVIDLAQTGLTDFTFDVSPDTTDSKIAIRVELSFDGGVTYSNVGTFSAYTSLRWVSDSGERAPTHLMAYRVTGTSTASEILIGA